MSRLKQLAELRGHSDRVWAVAWSPDGALLASCSGDKSVRVWGPLSGGRGAQADEVRRYGSWTCLLVLEDGPTRTVRSCCWSPCGRFLVAVSFDGTVVIWQRQAGLQLHFEQAAVLEGHDSEVKSVAWHAEGDLLATCGRDKSVWIWEVVDGDYECAAVLHGHEGDVKAVRWHPIERLLFSASYDDTVRVWAEDEDDWYCIDTLRRHTSTVWSLAVEPAGERLATAGADGNLIVWKRYPRRPVGVVSDDNGGDDGGAAGGGGAAAGGGGGITAPATAAYGAGGPGGAGGGTWRSACQLGGYHRREIYTVDWSAAGHLATGGGDDCIRIFRESEGSSARSDAPSFDLEVTRDAAHGGDVNCVAWSPAAGAGGDGNGDSGGDSGGGCGVLASAGDDETVRLWLYEP